MNAWKYCKIMWDKKEEGATQYLFTRSGYELQWDSKKKPSNLSTDNAVARLINELGEDGWELVSVVRTERFENWYFKHPIMHADKN